MTVFGIDRCDYDTYWVTILSCVCSSLCAITSLPVNGVVLLAIWKNVKFHTNFHFIVFNIVLAEFCISIILCPLATDLQVNKLTKTNLNVNLKEHLFRFSLLFFGIVCLLSMTVLSIDRMISLKIPNKYREMKKRYFIISLVSVWMVAALLTPLYFFVRFTLLLIVMITSIVLVTTIIMSVTYLFYRKKLKETFKRSNTSRNHSNSCLKCNSSTSKRDSITSTTQYKVQSIRNKLKKHLKRESNASYVSVNQTSNQEELHMYQIEKRAANTFFCILVGFLVSYMPLIGMSLYLHFCRSCSCSILEILEQTIMIVAMGNSVFTTLIFLLRLTALRKSCAALFLSEKQVERRWRAESIPAAKKKESLKEKLIKRKKHRNNEKNEETCI